jgi:hypothetical protein
MAGDFNTSTGRTFEAVDFQIVSPTLTTESFSGKVRRIGQGHQFYTFGVKFPALTPYQFGPVIGFISKQFGQVDSFTISLPDISFNTGQNAASIGNPVVRGYRPLGGALITQPPPLGYRSVDIGGMTPLRNQVLRAGDFFRFAGHTKVYMATDDLNSDGGGAGTLNFSGGLVVSPLINQGIFTNDVKFTVILDSDIQEYSLGYGGMTQYSFRCREVW